MARKKAKSETKSPKQPTIRRQKRLGRQDTAFAVIDGQRIHLGIFGTQEAEKEYRRAVAEWNTGLITPKKSYSNNTTIAELVLRFLKERKYKVSPTQWDNERRPANVLVSLYGDKETSEFDINCLLAVRNVFIQKRYVRKKINDRIRSIIFIFRWGVSYKLVPSTVYHELKALISLKKGENNLPESKERRTVSLDDIEKTLAK